MISKFITPIEIEKSDIDITHQTPVCLIGSCFTEHIGKRLEKLKFITDLNPFGILYNPSSIKICIERIIKGTLFSRHELFQHDFMWHSFMHHSRFSDLDAEVVLQKINTRLKDSSQFLKQCQVLIVTFGTARIYIHKENGQIISNCHKLPSPCFEEKLLTAEEIILDWSLLITSLKNINPKLNVIFTVSPIRYLKDTAHGNMVSKATLFYAIHKICSQGLATYFPAYEIMMDELRDYRFYEPDMIHPSNEAIDYIFYKFSQAYFTPPTFQLNEKIEQIIKAVEHRFDFPKHPAVKSFKESMLKRILQLKLDYPYLNFEREIAYFNTL